MQKALAIVNQLEQEGVIGRYAIGGAVAATRYIEPIQNCGIVVGREGENYSANAASFAEGCVASKACVKYRLASWWGCVAYRPIVFGPDWPDITPKISGVVGESVRAPRTSQVSRVSRCGGIGSEPAHRRLWRSALAPRPRRHRLHHCRCQDHRWRWPKPARR
jgi:hypothetical protein